MRILMVIKILITITLATSLWPSHSSAQTASYDFALFNSERASWQPEVEALKDFLHATGKSFEEVDARMIQTGVLQPQRHRALLMPGGLVGKLSYELSASGVENIRDFIHSGGGYLGICAGAALAACRFEVALETAPGKSAHSPSDYFNIRYPHLLQLWPGEARSPYEWAPFLRGGRVEGVQITGQAPLAQGLPAESRMFYLAGPSLPMADWTPDKLPVGLEIWGKIQPPPGIELDPLQRAAIVKFQYGRGKVVLFAHHPIVPIEGGDALDLTKQPEKLDAAMARSQDSSSNWRNWNLLNAAMLTVTNEPVQTLNKQETLRRMTLDWKRKCELSFRSAL